MIHLLLLFICSISSFQTSEEKTFSKALESNYELCTETVDLILEKLRDLNHLEQYPSILETLTEYIEQLEINPSDETEWNPQEDGITDPSHHLLFENEKVRILEVINEPGVKEYFHTHQWHSLDVSFVEAPFTYFNGMDGTEGPYHTHFGVEHYGPEGLHAVQNNGHETYRSLRIEIKSPIAP